MELNDAYESNIVLIEYSEYPNRFVVPHNVEIALRVDASEAFLTRLADIGVWGIRPDSLYSHLQFAPPIRRAKHLQN